MENWILLYTGWNPGKQFLREALYTLGKAIFCIRWAAGKVPENDDDYPGTCLAVGNNRRT